MTTILIIANGSIFQIYEFVYECTKHKIAVTIGPNGFIVGANPKSTKE
jgi:hypothetical protein